MSDSLILRLRGEVDSDAMFGALPYNNVEVVVPLPTIMKLSSVYYQRSSQEPLL